jgi:hypothetical protein
MTGAKILLVEDNERNMKLFRIYFQFGQEGGRKSGSDGTRTRDLRRDRPAF